MLRKLQEGASIVNIYLAIKNAFFVCCKFCAIYKLKIIPDIQIYIHSNIKGQHLQLIAKAL